MHKNRKKQRERRWREGERAEARAALPLPFEELKVMFDMLDAALARHGCDHTRRLTRLWLEGRGHDTEHIFAWLDEHGGFCDCEVLANVERHVDDAVHGDWRGAEPC